MMITMETNPTPKKHRARFRVYAATDMASRRPSPATVIIDRNTGLFSVRPFKRRRTYDMLLDDVASIVVNRVVYKEVQEKKAAKKKAGRR